MKRRPRLSLLLSRRYDFRLADALGGVACACSPKGCAGGSPAEAGAAPRARRGARGRRGGGGAPPAAAFWAVQAAFAAAAIAALAVCAQLRYDPAPFCG